MENMILQLLPFLVLVLVLAVLNATRPVRIEPYRRKVMNLMPWAIFATVLLIAGCGEINQQQLVEEETRAKN